MKNYFLVNEHNEMENYKVKALYDEKIYMNMIGKIARSSHRDK